MTRLDEPIHAFAISRTPIPCECGDHVFVALTRGYTTMVSPIDGHLLQKKWYAEIYSGKPRAKRLVDGYQKGQGGARNIDIATVILRPAAGYVADHIHGDALDNRRSNLRIATPQENSMNRRATRGRKHSLPKGVTIIKKTKRFEARIQVNHQKIRLGIFGTPEEASAAYREAALRLHGSFARDV